MSKAVGSPRRIWIRFLHYDQKKTELRDVLNQSNFLVLWCDAVKQNQTRIVEPNTLNVECDGLAEGDKANSRFLDRKSTRLNSSH